MYGTFRHTLQRLAAVVTVLLPVGLASCGTDTTPINSSVVAIRLTPDAATLHPGETQLFAIQQVWTNGTTTAGLAKNAVWTSSDPAIATVAATGEATMVAVGDATITAKMGARLAKAVLHVQDRAVLAVHVSPPLTTLTMGGHGQLLATAIYDDGSSGDVSAKAVWSSGDPTTVTVDAKGLVTAIQGGSAEVTATLGLLSDAAMVNVTQNNLIALVLEPAAQNVTVGGKVQINAYGIYATGPRVDVTTQATWSSLDTSIVTVNSSGQVTGVKAGQTSVRATLAGLHADSVMDVKAKLLVAVQVTPALATIALGGTQAFVATANYDDGTTANVTALATWSSSNPVAVSIDSAGVATGLLGGKAVQIHAVFGATDGWASLVVSAATIATIELAPAGASLAKGQALQFQATATLTDGTMLNVTLQATWSSTATAIATVNAQGMVTAVATGTSLIHATVGAVTGTRNLVVTDATVTGVAVTPSMMTSFVGGPLMQFKAMAALSDGSYADVTAQATWLSSDVLIAAIDAQGKATPLAQGAAQVSATYQGVKSGYAAISVAPAVVSSVQVLPATASLAKGKSLSFKAIATLSDGSTSDLTSSVAWQSSNLNVATVTAGGLVYGLAAGEATITATFQGKVGDSVLTVSPATLQALAISAGSSLPLQVGATRQFAALGTYSDGTVLDVTLTSTWLSSDGAKLSISNAVGSKGLSTALAAGSVGVSAMLGSTTSPAVQVVIQAKALVAIQVTPALSTVAINGTQAYVAMANFDDGSTLDVSTLANWSSSDLTVATVSASGLAKGLQGGKAALISAQYMAKTGSASLVVSAATVASIALNPAVASMAKGQSRVFQATATMTDGALIDVTSQATWTTTAPAIAQVNASGLLIGLGVGQTSVQAVYGAKTGAAQVTVTGAIVTGVQVSPAATTTFIGGPAVLFTATASFSDLSSADVTSQATWYSATPAVASISTLGKATALATGSTLISAMYQGMASNSAMMAVGPAVVVSLEVLPPSATIAKGTTLAFQALATLSDGTKADLSSLVGWQSSNTGLATVATSGVATALQPGAITLSATFQGKYATSTLTVSPATLTSLDVTPALSSPMPLNATRPYKAIGTYSDNTTQDVTEQVIWQTSNAGQLAVSNASGSHGIVTALAEGNPELWCSAGNIVAPPVQIKVSSGVVLASITLWPSSATLIAGQAQRFVATGHYSDGSAYDVSTSAVWDVVDINGAAIAGFASVSNGLVAALQSTANVSGGLVRIRAHIGAVSTFAPLVVKASVITGITVACDAPLSCLPSGIGFQTACTATANFDDNTTGDITTTATWSSTAPAIATTPVIVNGRAWTTSVGNGTAVLTAAQGGKISVASPTSTLYSTALTLNAVTVSPPVMSLAKGFTQQYQASGLFSGGECASVTRDVTRLATWSSSIALVAPISNAPGSKGLASASTPGTTTITATLGLVSGAAQLAVSTACLQQVRIEQANPTWPSKVQVPLTVVGYYSDAPQTPVPIEPGSLGAWSSSAVNPQTWMLSIGNSTPGALTFTVLTGACSAAVTDTTTVTLDGAALPTALALAPANAQITKGAYQDYTATATYEVYGSFNVSSFCGWSVAQQLGLSWGPQAADMTERFQHQGLLAGTTTVAAAYKNRTASAGLTISGSTVAQVVIIETLPSMPQLGVPVGLNLRFRARVTWSDGTFADNPSGLSFSSSNPAKLAFQSFNMASTLAPSAGVDPTVTATYGDKSSVALVVKVSTATLMDLQFGTPSGGSMPRNSVMPLMVTGLYSDGSSFDVSALVAAGSGNAAVVQVAISATGVILTSYGTTTTTPVKISFMKDSLTRHFYIGVSGACQAALSLTPAVGSMAIGQTIDFVAKATDTGGSDLNVSQASGISWPNSNTLLLNLGNVQGPARRYRALEVGTGTMTVTFTSANVCAGGDVTLHTLTTTVSIDVTDATPVSLQIQPQPGYNQTARRVPLGQAVQFRAMATLTNGQVVDVSSGSGTTWNTQKPAFATVSNGGLLSAQGVGLTILTATTANGTSADLLVEVQNCGIPTVAVATSATGKLPLGTMRTYTATAQYGSPSGCTASSSERAFDVTALAQFTSTDTAVVSISSGGTLAGKALALTAGTVQIGANYLGAMAPTLSLTAVAVALEQLSISAASSTYKNGQFDVTVTARYTDGGTGHWNLTPPALVWNVFDPTVISMNNGTVTGLKQGGTQYFAQAGAIVSNTLSVQVTSACVQSVQLLMPAGNVTWPGGVPFTMAASCTSSDNSVMTCHPDFYSDDPDHVVSEANNFQSNGVGHVAFGATAGKTATLRATISHSHGACSGAPVQSSAVVTVGAATLTALDISPIATSIARGLSATFTAMGQFSGGTGAGAYDLTAIAAYASNNPGIATSLNDGHGTIHAGNSDGTAFISATYQGITSAFAALTVSGKVPDALSILSEPNLVGGSSQSATYPIGGYRLQLSAVAHYSDNTWGDISPSVAWSLKMPALADASVDANGLFSTGSVAGNQIVVATLDSLTAEFTVHNVTGTLVNILVTNASGNAPAITVPKGLTEQYMATFKLSGSTQAGPYWSGSNFAWSTGDSALASVAMGGNYHQVAVLHALNLGTTSLAAKVGLSTSGPLAVTVTDTVPVSLACQPESTSVTAGSRIQLRAIATMADSSTNDVSASADWNHPVTSILSIDPVGLATALMTGNVGILPQLGGLISSNACSITVTVP